MDDVDGSERYGKASSEQSPSLLAVILDTSPAAWSLLADTLPLSSVVANLLVFINAHLASNYTNKVAVIASHCDKAEWLYPTSPAQRLPGGSHSTHEAEHGVTSDFDGPSTPLRRLKLNGPKQNGTGPSDNKYRPFRLIEEELITNLTSLLASTSSASVANSTTTMIAGALTLALSHVNRETISYSESTTGISNPDTNTSTDPSTSSTKVQARILLLTASPSTDLAHQYIPIMNSIFACQRLSIPIDILQIPLPSSASSMPASTSTVFLQQASTTTNGIFIPFRFPPNSTSASSAQALQTYLLTSLLPSPSTRLHLVPPTTISVDFRAACFCHRRVIDTGFVCSICLSIFCSPPNGGECLTCGSTLTLGEVGKAPVVVKPRKKGKKSKGKGRIDPRLEGSNRGED